MEILSFLVVIGILVLFLKILTFPIKLILKFVINSVVGGIILYVCAFFGFIVVVNWWIIVLTGLFGVPGLGIGILISMFI